ncbi:hypothetical protein, partial [Phocaeicola vulgatus]|uniref:hypothetical protein n=1 Tax=Phocaeicola vulgatus TaxID=821 RepID=UPI003561C47D
LSSFKFSTKVWERNMLVNTPILEAYSRNADGQGVCGGAEAYEGFFRIFSTGHYKRPYPTEKGNICS